MHGPPVCILLSAYPTQAHNVFHQHSGASDGSLFYCQAQGEMHEKYPKVFEQVRAAVEACGGQIRGNGKARAKKTFVHSALKQMGLLKK